LHVVAQALAPNVVVSNVVVLVVDADDDVDGGVLILIVNDIDAHLFDIGVANADVDVDLYVDVAEYDDDDGGGGGDVVVVAFAVDDDASIHLCEGINGIHAFVDWQMKEQLIHQCWCNKGGEGKV
jgi:hypothetical protein